MEDEAEKTAKPMPIRPPLVASNRAAIPIIPSTFDEVYRIANAVVKSGLAPKDISTPEKATIIIMHGLEVGLSPMVALQSIAVINGKPALYGDGALAVVRASGLMEKFSERLQTSELNILAVCTVKRAGETTMSRSFSKDDAQRAGLWGKPGPWTAYPQRMLTMRARSFALRDGFADVLRGLGIREEVEDIEPDLLPPPPPPPPERSATANVTPLERAIAKAEADRHKPVKTDAEGLVIWEDDTERPATEHDRV